MFKHRLFKIYPFEDVPLNQDFFIMDEKWLAEYESGMLSMFNGGDYPVVGYVSYASVRHINEFSLEISWYPNLHSRFHEVPVTLPRDQFVTCVGCYDYDDKTRIFVKGEWLSNLYLRPYSAFALVDAIGVKDALARHRIDKHKLASLRERIDLIAKENPSVAFVTAADTLLLKSNWSVGTFDSDVEYTYEPEALIKLLPELSDLYADVLGLRIYAAITQGLNEYYDEKLLHISGSGNHVCLNSLGLPFAQLLAIDNAARDAIRKNIHRPSDLYMDDHFFHSLRFRYEFDKEKQSSAPYKSPLSGSPSSYYFCSLETILSNLKAE